MDLVPENRSFLFREQEMEDLGFSGDGDEQAEKERDGRSRREVHLYVILRGDQLVEGKNIGHLMMICKHLIHG